MNDLVKNTMIKKYQRIILFIIIIFINNLQAQEFEFIAQHEGESTSIGYFNNYIYFNSGGNINILKHEINNNFTLINSFYCGNSYPNDITVDSNIMYLSTFGAGVMIYDLSNPSNPELISAASDYYPYYRHSFIADTILIALAEEYAILYNISDIKHPEYISNINYWANRNCTYALSNNLLYGFYQDGYSGAQYLRAYSIENPVNPNLVAEFQLCENFQNPWPDDMVSDKNNLFVAFNDTLKIYDISEPDSIIFKTQFSVPNEICNIQLEDTMIYISVLDSGVFIFSISNLFEPELTGLYNQPVFIDELAINGDFIYSALKSKGFRIADKSYIQNIQDVYDYSFTNAVYSVHIENNFAYFGMKESGLQIVDIKNLLEPVKYGNIETLTDAVVDIKSIQDYLYCLGYYGNKIDIIDVRDSLNPQVVGEIVPEHTMLLDYCIDENILYLLDSVEYIKAYDLSIPESPILINTIQEYSNHLDVKGDLLVLGEKIGIWPSPFQIKIKLFEIGNNSATLLSDIVIDESVGYSLKQIEIDYPYIYVRTRTSIVVLKINDNNSMSFCDEMIIGGYFDFSTDLSYDDHYIYVSGSFGIIVINKTDPNNLKIEQIINKWSLYLASFGNNICFASETAGYYFYRHNSTEIKEHTTKKNDFNIRCFPNPCNYFTTIYFSIPNNEKAKLEIYNLSGKNIGNFDITNKNRFRLKTDSFTSGIYFYKVSINGFSSIKKIIVTR